MHKCLEESVGGVVAIDTSMSISNGTAGGFNLGYVKRTLVQVKTAAWTPCKSPNRMMRVARIKTAEENISDVGFPIPSSILEEHEIWFLRDISAAVAKFKSSR